MLTRPAEKFLPKPARINPGYSTLPTVATVAALAPEIGADQRRGADGRDAKTAGHAADQRQHPVDQAPRDAGAAHEFAGVDKERNREQRVVLKPAEHDLVQRDRRHGEHERERRKPAGEEDEIDRRSEKSIVNREDRQRPGHAERAWFAASGRISAAMSFTSSTAATMVGAGESDDHRKMRDRHRDAERHAGLADARRRGRRTASSTRS